MNPLVGEERREFQRLRLDPPLPATFGAGAVTILEIGVLGARVHHAEPLDTTYAELRFSHGDATIALKCEMVRSFPSGHSKYPSVGLESGLRFLAAIGDSGDSLRTMLSDLVIKEFESTRPPMQVAPGVDGDRTVRGRDAKFICYRLEQGAWNRRRVFLPEQPKTGFTVASAEDSDEMQRLCKVYQASDEEGRRLIRLFAELSVSDALEIPPRAQR
jgi:hypothetical protein